MNLNTDQRAAVEEPGHCLIVACPGSGKTTLLVEKASYVLSKDPRARIVAVTFTRDAALEIKKRVHERMAGATQRVVAGTFHGLSYHMLRDNGKRSLSVLAEAEHLAYAARAAKNLKINIATDEAAHIIEQAKVTSERADPSSDAGRLYAAYEELLRRNHVLDFQDLVRRAVDGMRDGTLAPLPCTHLFIDEFQDTDPLQYEWVRQYGRVGAMVAVVGDDDQSVFGWRFALGFAGMQRFETDFTARRITLSINYRCRGEIMTPAARLIAANIPRMPKALIASRGAGGAIERRLFEHPEEEAQKICEAVDEEPTRWAVLARNNHRLNLVEGFFTALSIPYSRSGGKGLWERYGARLAIALCRAVGQVERPAHIDHILRFAGLSEDALKILHQALGDDLVGVRDSKRMQNAIEGIGSDELNRYREFVALFQGWRTACASSRHDLAVLGIQRWLDQIDASARELDEARIALTALRKLHGSLNERIQFVENRRKGQAPGVLLSTLHGAKGQEWDFVWIAAVEEGVLPDSDSPLTEERRLCYVGMTRAREQLTMSACCVRPESRFMREAGLLDDQITSGVTACRS